jgi:hypothetical protein
MDRGDRGVSMLLEPIALRSCSRCFFWRVSARAEREDVLVSLCSLHNAVRRGGDTCGAWRKIPKWDVTKIDLRRDGH